MVRFDVRSGYKKIKTRTFLAFSGMGLVFGAATLLVFGSANAFGNHTLYVGHGAIGNGKSCSSPGYNSVQAAVNAANTGDTVYLCDGQFSEQVFVGKSITLTGDPGSGLTANGTTFSSNAADYPSQFASDGLYLPQALLVTTGSNVSVNGLKISGPMANNSACAQDDYGVLALDGNINLKNDDVANIADSNSALYGCQFGVAIQIGREYWEHPDFNPNNYAVENFTASADINNTTVTGYQKNGITIDAKGSYASVDNSMVVGGGFGAPFGTIIAQNGIQISRGAKASVNDSTIADNAYSGSGDATAAGVLVYGGGGDPLSTNITVQNNKFVGNDVAVNFANYSDDFSGSATSPTKNSAQNNWIFSARVSNTSGLQTSNDGWIGYQAGIEDVGDKDMACNNTIVGPGYTSQGTYDVNTEVANPGPDNAVVRDIDAGYTFPTTDFTNCSYHYGNGGHSYNHYKNWDNWRHHD